jgi:hypothetical protein
MPKTYIYLLIIVAFTIFIPLQAQQQEIKNTEVSGFYLSIRDFKNNILSKPTDRLHKGDKIKLHQFFIKPEIISIELGKKSIFYKDSIFAIKLNNGTIYRFVDRKPYKIADTSYLYIYTYSSVKMIRKQKGPRNENIEIPVTRYFFSTGNHDAAYPLSLENIIKYGLENLKLQKELKSLFTDDKLLYEVNATTGTYKVNELLLSKKE